MTNSYLLFYIFIVNTNINKHANECYVHIGSKYSF